MLYGPRPECTCTDHLHSPGDRREPWPPEAPGEPGGVRTALPTLAGRCSPPGVRRATAIACGKHHPQRCNETCFTAMHCENLTQGWNEGQEI